MTDDARICQNCKGEFTVKPDELSFLEKIKVPLPTWCPLCRFQRRAAFRNERKLFRNINGVTGEPMLSLFPKETGFPVYESTYWFSDEWDAFAYGRDFDRSKPFLQQVLELSKVVPHPRGSSINMVRSEYSDNASDLKDCYLCFNSNNTEDSAYCNGVDFSKNCFDDSHVQRSERCYESFWLTGCYDTHFSSMCDDCVSVWFSKSCRGCTNCFGCVNLRNQSYCIWNEQYSKEEYNKKIKEFQLHSWESLSIMKEKSKEFWLRFPVKYLQGVQNHAVSGEYVSHSKNVHDSYLVREAEDMHYTQYAQVPPIRDVMDSSIVGKNTELLYECCVAGWGSSNLKFCWECWDGGMDLEYCMFSGRKGNHLFGCVGIRSGDYVILNKQYPKEEFLALKEEIKKHMNTMPYIDAQGRVYTYGEFFPPEFSPLGYNSTIAPEHIPLTKEEAIAFGSTWYEVPIADYETTIDATKLPDSIQNTDESILKEVITCMQCKRAFRIIASELQFLKQNNIPIPRMCVDCRHAKRISMRNKVGLYDRTCMCSGVQSTNGVYSNTKAHSHASDMCKNTFRTSYSSERPEVVYCEECYQQEVS